MHFNISLWYFPVHYMHSKVWGWHDFLKEVSDAHQDCIYLIKNSVILFSILIYIKMLFIPVMPKSLLQFSVSHDPPEIILLCWFGAQ